MKGISAAALVFSGIAGGGAIGWALAPGEPVSVEAPPTEPAAPEHASIPDEPGAGEFVRFDRQVVIPVVEGERTRALMLFSIALEVRPGTADAVYDQKPRLMDAFLRDLFAMSHTGAFLSSYTDDRVLDELRTKLLDSARVFLGDDITDVLLLEVIRQET